MFGKTMEKGNKKDDTGMTQNNNSQKDNDKFSKVAKEIMNLSILDAGSSIINKPKDLENKKKEVIKDIKEYIDSLSMVNNLIGYGNKDTVELYKSVYRSKGIIVSSFKQHEDDFEKLLLNYDKKKEFADSFKIIDTNNSIEALREIYLKGSNGKNFLTDRFKELFENKQYDKAVNLLSGLEEISKLTDDGARAIFNFAAKCKVKGLDR